MTQRIDLTGQTFNRWTVVSYAGARRWNCVCECGTPKVVFGTNLTKGLSTSCGCFRNERIRAVVSTHDGRHTPEYAVWSGIKRRCHNPNDPAYPAYGGRGVCVHADWLHDFPAFLAHIGPKPTPEHTIDRIDGTRGYEPGNVRWATRREQAQNTKKNRYLTFNGKTQTQAEWARELGISYKAISARAIKGLPVERILAP